MRLERQLSALVVRAQHAILRVTWNNSQPILPGTLTVSGFLNDALGIGRAGRLTVSALQDAGLKPNAHDLRTLWPHRSFTDGPAPNGKGGAWILHCNAPEAVVALAKASRRDWASTYRIAYWAYELETAPALWRRAAAMFHEIWAPSRFVAEALREAGPPVRIMPHPVSVEAIPPQRPKMLAPDVKHVLAVGDIRSSGDRKNLLGAAQIYMRAFPDASKERRLLIKLLTQGRDTRSFADLRGMIADRDDIHLVAEEMTDADVQALIAHSDIVVHPHRAEGYGLVIAEAFLLGTPVLATAWSGNLDYMADAKDLLIPARLIPVNDRDRVYSMRGARWADPDIGIAAEKLRALLADPHLARDAVSTVRKRLAEQQRTWSRESLAALPFFNYIATNAA